MFRKLRIKFIATATLAIALILTFFLVLMNSIVYTQTEGNIHTVLSILTKNEGELPITDEIKESLTEKISKKELSTIFNTSPSEKRKMTTPSPSQMSNP